MFLGILAMVLVGCSWTFFGYVMGKAPKRNIDVAQLLFISSLMTIVVSLLIACVQGCIFGFPQVSAFGWFMGIGVLIGSGLVNYFQLEFMSRAMQNGPNGIIWTITQSGFILPFFMGILFFSVPLSLFRLLGFLAILVALVIMGFGKDNSARGKWKLWVLIAFLGTGFSQVLSNLPSYYTEADGVTSIWRTMSVAVGMALGALLVKAKDLKNFFPVLKVHFCRKDVWAYCSILLLFELVTSFFLLYYGMDLLVKNNAGSIAYPIMVSSCLICFELFAIIALRERRSLAQWLALFLCLAGIVGICMQDQTTEKNGETQKVQSVEAAEKA